LADPVIGQSGPRSDGLGSGFMTDEAQGEIKTKPVAAVTIVGNAHGVYLLGLAEAARTVLMSGAGR
ncbi:MAG TPA: hypothetical protein VIY90_24030, partial [Steroidobacteraceae bacterium]